uniref:Uncharacterized protein n=1 Tax=Rhizophagus irregularis (strain DAOM 181602 / DAOM 197198 / MUCL 43194) TaxID=747089 RepID=U9UGT0_RHIID
MWQDWCTSNEVDPLFKYDLFAEETFEVRNSLYSGWSSYWKELTYENLYNITTIIVIKRSIPEYYFHMAWLQQVVIQI